MALTLPEPGFRLTEPALRLAALIRHNAMLMLREPGPVISRLLQPLVLIDGYALPVTVRSPWPVDTTAAGS